MTSSSRTRRGWKLLFLALAIPLIAGIVVAVWINRVADRRWGAAQERIRELSVAFPPPKPRPADATSSETAKDIQAMFVSAIRLAIQRQERRKDVSRLCRLPAPGPEAEAVLDDVSDILERIHSGARRSVASPTEFPPSWRGEWDEGTLHYLVECSVLRSRRRREQGKPAEAAEALLDGLPMVRFWGQSEAPTNRTRALNYLVLLHEEMRVLLSREHLSPDELRTIDHELELSETWLQLPYRLLERQFARWSEDLLNLQLKGFLDTLPFRWRFLLPAQLMKAEAFEFMDRHNRAILSSEGKPYLEWLHCEQTFWKEAVDSKNPLINLVTIEWGDPGWRARERRAEVRLLRTAARYRATGELLPLEDPFGGLLLHSESQERMTFWSLNVNGADDGGRLETSGPWWGDPLEGALMDLVIEVPKWKRE